MTVRIDRVELQRIVAGIERKIAHGTEVEGIGIRSFPGSYWPVAPDYEMCFAVSGHLCGDNLWQFNFASRVGNLVSCFHVGEARLLCLYHNPHLYVAMRFFDISAFTKTHMPVRKVFRAIDQPITRIGVARPNIDAPLINLNLTDLEKLDSAIAVAFRTTIAKLKRGEVFQCVNKLTILRSLISTMLPLHSHGEARPRIKFLERDYPEWVERFAQTVPGQYADAPAAKACFAMLQLYIEIGAAIEQSPVTQKNREVLVSRLSDYLHGNKSATLDDSNGMTLFFAKLCRAAVQSSQIDGIAIGGSWLGGRTTGESGGFDQHSDLDLYIAFDALPDSQWCETFVRSLGEIKALQHSRTMYIMALYGTNLDKVDFRFVTTDSLAKRWETPHILWERNGAVSSIFSTSTATSQFNEVRQSSLYWLDAQVVPSLESALQKIMKRRLFQAIADINSIRVYILGPLMAVSEMVPARGVRRIEYRFPRHVEALAETIAEYDAESCMNALKAAFTVYVSLRNIIEPLPQSWISVAANTKDSGMTKKLWSCFISGELDTTMQNDRIL